MKKISAAFCVGLLSVAAFPPPAFTQPAPPSQATADVSTDWSMLIGATNHLGKSIQTLAKENADLRAEVDKLKKDLEDAKKGPPKAADKSPPSAPKTP